MVKLLHDKNGKEEWIDANKMIKPEIRFFDSYLYFKHRIEKRYHLDPGIRKMKMVYGDLALR